MPRHSHDYSSCTSRPTGGVHSSSEKPLMKPVKPTPYNKSRDPMIFSIFVQQVTLYLDSYCIPMGGYPATVAQFLKGQAYCYYANTLAKDPERWDLCSILVGLFNYCFPIDFYMQICQKLEVSSQGELFVTMLRN